MSAPNPDPNSIHDFVIPEPYVSQRFPEGDHNETGNEVKFIDALNTTP